MQAYDRPIGGEVTEAICLRTDLHRDAVVNQREAVRQVLDVVHV